MKKRHFAGAIALATAAALGLTACAGGAKDDDTITLGYIPAWADAKTTAYLLKDQFERLGHDVEVEEFTEVAVLYTAVAEGDVDMYTSAWPEVTQESYWEQYKDQLESVNVWYDHASITLAVPDYVEIDSLEELAENPEMFDGQIIGIEPSAGQMKVTEESAMPAYGLDEDFELVSSSFATMLAELQTAVDAQEPIVVTLSRPHWANDRYGLKDLEDPKKGLGDTEKLHMVATKGFSERFPDAAELMQGIQLDDEAYGALEDRIMNEYDGDEEAGVEDWLQEFPDAFSTILTE